MKNKNQLVSENPFYGLKNLFSLYQNGTKGSIRQYLTDAWKEAKDNHIFRQLFHVICFAIGDITNRKHNIFKDKVDDGGNSANAQWIEYINWLVVNEPKTFVRLLPYIVEYVGLRELTTCQVKTQKGKTKVLSHWGLLPTIQSSRICYQALIDLLINYMNSNNPFKKYLVAKFVKIPRYSKRIRKNKAGIVIGRRELQDLTKKKMNAYADLVTRLSEANGWTIDHKDSYVSYTGYREWQKKYNSNLEYVLFATNRITEFDREQFVNWLNFLPSGARYRVRRRLLDDKDKDKGKWKNLASWFLSWEKSKEDLQKTQRVLQEKEKLGTITTEEKEQLVKVKKEAKVTTGGSTLIDQLELLLEGRADSTILQSILDKVNFEIPVLSIQDVSGSMKGRPCAVASLLTTLVMLKKPNSLENMFITFASDATVITDNSLTTSKTNRFMSGQSIKVVKLVDIKDSFPENFNRIYSITKSMSGSTNFAGVAERLKNWVESASTPEEKSQRVEQILEYQVFLVTSDGDRKTVHVTL